ncbi:MAG TPA: hypothetical protein PKD55_18795 [Bellilinea sp.]|nr:hypothetical protein [Bellilinea sp.]
MAQIIRPTVQQTVVVPLVAEVVAAVVAPVHLAIPLAPGVLGLRETLAAVPLAMKWSAIAGAPMATVAAAVVVVEIPPCLTVPHPPASLAAASSMTPI